MGIGTWWCEDRELRTPSHCSHTVGLRISCVESDAKMDAANGCLLKHLQVLGLRCDVDMMPMKGQAKVRSSVGAESGFGGGRLGTGL